MECFVSLDDGMSFLDASLAFAHLQGKCHNHGRKMATTNHAEKDVRARGRRRSVSIRLSRATMFGMDGLQLLFL